MLRPELRLASAVEVESSLQHASPPLIIEAACSHSRPTRPVIPGAIILALEDIDFSAEDAPGQPSRVSGNYSLRPAAELRAALEAAGVTCLRPTVVYTQSVKCGGLDLAVACRLCWALSLAGVQQLTLLAGGTRAWTDAGFELAPAPAEPTPRDFFEGSTGALSFPMHPEYDAATSEVEK